MIKDTWFKVFCIPILGIIIPLLSGLIRYQSFTIIEVLVANVYFILTGYLVWQGAVQIVIRIRRLQFLKQKTFLKLFLLCLSTAVFSFTIVGTSAFLWQKIFTGAINTTAIVSCSIIGAASVVFLTLVYEALFLYKERELDVKIVDILDRERIFAEMNALKGELDPHFIFNSLTTLSHLISTDVDKAQLFIQKLAQVYKYFLINKEKELISLEQELRFVEDYFFLLKIRYDDKLQLSFTMNGSNDKAMVLPCSLQLLIENAIKHNRFSDNEPLQICISLNGEYVKVENNICLKQYAVDSTKIGLLNLSNRYRLIYHKDIVVSRTEEKFTVHLPLIKQNSL